MIEKPTIVITSTGRTGTKFFAKLFGELYPSCSSLHEPDILTIGSQSSLAIQFKDIGLYYFLRKLFSQWSIAEISDALITDSISRHEAIKRFIKQRKSFIESRQGKMYIESSFGYYGLIEILGRLFRTYRGIYVIRDGREWVRSFMDRGLRKRNPIYDKGPLMRIISHSWPNAKQFDGDPFQEQWKHMDRFQRLCWAWSTLNSQAIKAVQKNDKCKLVKFEDIFTSNIGEENLLKVIQFVADIHEIKPDESMDLESLLSVRPNVSLNEYPSWDSWSNKQREFFIITCEPLMQELGYQV